MSGFSRCALGATYGFAAFGFAGWVVAWVVIALWGRGVELAQEGACMGAVYGLIVGASLASVRPRLGRNALVIVGGYVLAICVMHLIMSGAEGEYTKYGLGSVVGGMAKWAVYFALPSGAAMFAAYHPFAVWLDRRARELADHAAAVDAATPKRDAEGTWHLGR